MTSRSAFTLLEVLFAIVLLALVVAVCVPFLKASGSSDDGAERSAFLALIEEEIAQFSHSHSDGPSEKQFQTIFQSIGIDCVKIGIQNDSLDGQWIRLSDGRFETIRWARLDESNSEATQ